MSFALAGSTITQSGTDTLLAGLSGIAGVLIYLEAGRTIYNVGARNLVFNGTLTINATIEGIVTDVPPASNGTVDFNSGCNVTVRDYAEDTNGNIYYFSNKWLSTLQQNTKINFNGGSTVKFFGGWTNLRGPTTHFSPINFGNTPTEFTNHIIGDYTLPFNNNFQVRMSNASAKFDGLTLVRVAYTPLAIPLLLSGVNFIDAQIIPSGLSPSTEMVFMNSKASIGDILSKFHGGKKVNLTNPEKGTGYKVVNHVAGGSSGTIQFTRNVKIKTTGMAGSNIYIKDQINANRVDGNGYTFTPDRVYIQTTDSNGETPTFNVLVGVANEPTTSAYYNTAVAVPDIRFPSDVATAHIWNYGFVYASESLNLKGNNDLNVATASLPDVNVTLTEANAIAKLASSFSVNTGTNTITVTANSTLDDLYDAMKAWKTRNIQSQLEYPTIATQPVTASGDALVTAMSVVGIEFLTTGTKFKKLQATCTASGAFSIEVIGTVNQATPTNLPSTAKATTLVYNTNTATSVTYATGTTIGTVRNDGTGIVTIAGGSITTYTDAEINYLNSTATIQLPTGFDIFAIYSSNADALAEVNPIFSGDTANNVIRYKAELYGGQTIYIRPSDNDIVGEVLIMPQVVPVGVGNYNFTVVSFSESTQLNTLIAQVTQLQTNLPKVNSNVIKASKLIPANETF